MSAARVRLILSWIAVGALASSCADARQHNQDTRFILIIALLLIFILASFCLFIIFLIMRWAIIQFRRLTTRNNKSIVKRSPRCPDCLEPIRICPNCRAYQDWRRYIVVLQPSLAIATALISVITVLSSILPSLFENRGPDIRLVLENATDNQMTFLARNFGQTGGAIQLEKLEIQGNRFWASTLLLDDKGTYVQPQQEQRISIPIRGLATGSHGVCEYLKKEVGQK
jgi:RNA polymerase subunit RPABC4/transcription elongation factor Spt4